MISPSCRFSTIGFSRNSARIAFSHSDGVRVGYASVWLEFASSNASSTAIFGATDSQVGSLEIDELPASDAQQTTTRPENKPATEK